MNLFSLREAKVFSVLKALAGRDCVVIGGYAVNAYALPRFSVDCDLVVKGKDLDEISIVLREHGFTVVAKGTAGKFGGRFARFEKKLEQGFIVSFDLMVDEVFDRQSKASFSSDWIFQHASNKVLNGKTIPDSVRLLVLDANALVAMKLVAGRKSDLRDVFMLLPMVDFKFVKREIGLRVELDRVLKNAGETFVSKDFKNNFQGVFGLVNEKDFERHLAAFKKLQQMK